MPSAPCRGCMDRCAYYHAVCDRYLDWRRDRDAAIARARLENEVEQVQIDNTMRVIRMKRRKERK